MSEKVSDLGYLTTFSNGDKARMGKYINMFLNHAPGQIEDMKRHLENENWEQLKIVAHSLKPQMTYMGIQSLVNVIRDIEEYSGNKRDLEKLPQLIVQVDTTIKKAFEELKAFV